jgi:hypothetical protein
LPNTGIADRWLLFCSWIRTSDILELDISNNRIGNEKIKKLFPTTESLTSLNISNNRLSGLFISTLNFPKNLQYLNLSGNRFSRNACALKNMPPSLTYLDISNCGHIVGVNIFLKSQYNLCTLDLSGCTVDDLLSPGHAKAIIAKGSTLTKGIKKLGNLECLVISITPAIIDTLAELFTRPNSIQTLEFSGTGLDPSRTAVQVASIVSNSPRLQTLELGDTCIDMDPILRAAHHHPSLTRLHGEKNKVSREEIDLFFENNSKIEHFSYRYLFGQDALPYPECTRNTDIKHKVQSFMHDSPLTETTEHLSSILGKNTHYHD